MPLTTQRAALLAGLIAFATIAGAWAFEYAGYLPCELCLMQRWAYYAGVPLAALAWITASRGIGTLTTVLLALVGLMFLANAGLAFFHSGVEMHWWDGPSACTGAMTLAPSSADFLKQLKNVQVVRCDAVAIRVLGLSLSNWNVLISLVIAGIAASGARRMRAG